jgi:Spy/CpxP family protein refolding chaperone
MKPQVSRKICLIQRCLIMLMLTGMVITPAWMVAGVAGQARKIAGPQTRDNLVSKPDKKNSPDTARAPQQPQQPPERRVIGLFTEQERHWVVSGLGNPIAQLLVLREIDRRIPFSDKQRAALALAAKEEGPQLTALRQKRQQQERALEEAIYGESFDPKQVEQLVNESAATQKELMKKEAEIEFRLVRIFAAENPRQARLYRVLYEHILGPQRNRPNAMAMNRPAVGQANAQARLLWELFGGDLEMMVPSFGNPLAVLLVMRQLDLTPEQKAEVKALAQEVRGELQAERELQNKLQRERDLPQRDEQERAETPLDRLENLMVDKVVEERANQQARAMKRQVHIETRIRQILNPNQWDEYTALLRAMVAGNLNRPLLSPAQPPNLKLRPGR